MLGPMKVGATAPAATVQVKTDDNKVYPITGATYAGWLFLEETQELVTLDPTRFSETDGPNGIFTYSWRATDTAKEGFYKVLFKLTIASDVVYVEETLPIEPVFPGVS